MTFTSALPVTSFPFLRHPTMAPYATQHDSCEQFLLDVARALGSDADGDADAESPMTSRSNNGSDVMSGVIASSDQWRHAAIEGAIKEFVAPTICVFGLVGNVLNLVVLTRKRLKCSMEDMEQSAHMGLVALALSDAFFCLFYLIALYMPQRFIYTQTDWRIGLYYNAYKESILNVFIFTSTYLTVVTAVGRYMAVCRPLHARGLISVRGTRAAILGVFVGSFVANSPRFLHFYIERVSCAHALDPGGAGPSGDGHDLYPGGVGSSTKDTVNESSSSTVAPLGDCPCFVYHQEVGQLYRNESFVFWFGTAWSVFVIVIPLAALAVCNACLVRALRQSRQVQLLYRANRPRKDSPSSASRQRITLTLVALIIMFIALVAPSGILSFFRTSVLQAPPPSRDPQEDSGSGVPTDSDSQNADIKTSSRNRYYYAYLDAAEITNCLLLVNFAVNFVLYCVINAQYRRIAVDVITCAWLRRRHVIGRGTGRGARIDGAVSSTGSAILANCSRKTNEDGGSGVIMSGGAGISLSERARYEEDRVSETEF